MRRLICLMLCFLLVYTGVPFCVFAEGNDNKSPYVIEPQYESADAFNKHGIARVQLPNTEEGEGKDGVINLKGEKVFGFDGTKFVIRKNGLIMALGENDKAAFFSKDGEKLTDYVYETFKRVQPKTPHEVTYHYLTDRHDGDGESDLVPICRDGKFGFINSRGEEEIAPRFNYVFGFYEGISRIGYDGVLSEYGTYTQCKFGYVNEKGEVLTNPLWAASDFHNGYATIADGEYKVIDKSGQAVAFPTGEFNFIETNGNFILAGYDGGHIVLDMNGNRLSDWAPTIQLFGKSFIIWQRQIADINGNIIYTAPEGTRIERGREGSPVAKIYREAVQNKISVQVDGLVNQDGEVIIEPQYKGLREVAEGIFWTPDSTSLFDVNGNSIAQLEGYSVSAYNKLSYKLLPVQSAETHKWGYVELPQIENPYVSEYTESSVYHVEKIIPTDHGTVLYFWPVGAPHGGKSPSLILIKSDGRKISLSEPVSREDLWHYPEHENITLLEDGKTLTFSVSFSERSAGTGADGEALVLHDAGTYYYKADLEKGTCIETRFEPLDKVDEDVISAWAKPEVEKAIDLGFVPIYLRENYKRNITRAEFAKMAMDFLSFSYGYSNAMREKGWSEVDYEREGYVNRAFLDAYCHAKPDRNGKPFMSGDAGYEYNSMLKIHMAEPFEKTEDFLYYESVIAAYNIGIVNGVSESEFNPNGDITRQEAAAMLMRVYKNYAEWENIQNDYLFADNDVIADWAKEDVCGINSLGVMQGMGSDTFAPLEHYTVEQAIATFLRLYEKAPVSRKNKNIEPLLEFAFEKEKLLQGISGGRGWVTADEKVSVFDDYTIVQGAWNERHYGTSDVIYVFYKSGGVTTLFSGQLTSEVEIDTAKNVIRYSAISSDTFCLYNQLWGSEKVYDKGEYLYEKDIETGNILRLEKLQ